LPAFFTLGSSALSAPRSAMTDALAAAAAAPAASPTLCPSTTDPSVPAGTLSWGPSGFLLAVATTALCKNTPDQKKLKVYSTLAQSLRWRWSALAPRATLLQSGLLRAVRR
jgi:hypothetical protein